jgi:anti-anti-sigma regulatory factor
VIVALTETEPTVPSAGSRDTQNLIRPSERVTTVPKQHRMSVDVQNGDQASASVSSSEVAPPVATLVVRLHRDATRCTASFSGSLTDATRITIDGLADLLAGEESVVFDLSRIDAVDKLGTDALEALIRAVRAFGSQVLIVSIPVDVNGCERSSNE